MRNRAFFSLINQIILFETAKHFLGLTHLQKKKQPKFQHEYSMHFLNQNPLSTSAEVQQIIFILFKLSHGSQKSLSSQQRLNGLFAIMATHREFLIAT